MTTATVPNASSRRSPSVLDLTPPDPIATNGELNTNHTQHSLTKRRRTNGGCLICSRRRKKCDEVRPTCQGCRKLGVDCQWPARWSSAWNILPLASDSVDALIQHNDPTKPVAQVVGNAASDERSRRKDVDHDSAANGPVSDTNRPIGPVQIATPRREAEPASRQPSAATSTETRDSSRADGPFNDHSLPEHSSHQAHGLPQSYRALETQPHFSAGETAVQSLRAPRASATYAKRVRYTFVSPQDRSVVPPCSMQEQHPLPQGPPELQVRRSEEQCLLEHHPQPQEIHPQSTYPSSGHPHIPEQSSSQMSPAQYHGSKAPPRASLPPRPRQTEGDRNIPSDMSSYDRQMCAPLPNSGRDRPTSVSSNQQAWPYRQMYVGAERSSATYRSTTYSSTKSFALEDVARSQMLRNAPYNHLDPTLVGDRKRCEKALERFRNACATDSGLDAEAVRRLLWQVFDPGRDTVYHSNGRLSERGDISHNVNVEGSFSCSYGYNITIHEGAYIDSQVFIDDAARIHIGARSWIGHGVKILTSVPYLEGDKHSMGIRVSRAVHIEDDVVVGQGVVLYPGVTLAKGSVIEPGSVIR